MKDIQDVTAIEAKKTSFRNVFLWSSYDAADTLFSQAVISLIFQPFVLLMAFYNGVGSYSQAFLYMSLFMALSNLLVALLGPFIGALSDTIGKRKPLVLIVASIMMLATLGMLLWKNWVWLCIMFVIANFCYQAGRMFFDSMIPFLSETKKRGFVSSISGSLSFIGTMAAIGIGMAVYGKTNEPDVPARIYEQALENASNLQPGSSPNFGNLWLFIILSVVAIALLTLPFIFSKEKTQPNENGIKKNLKIARTNFRQTLRELFKYKNALIFIIAWFFVTDAANTAILYMNAVLTDGGGGSPTDALIIIAVGGVLAMVGAIGHGILMDRIGPKKNFMINITAWGIAIILAIVATSLNGYHLANGIHLNEAGTASAWAYKIMFAMVIPVGIGFGGIWIIGRQFIYQIAPPSKVTQYMGFKQISGRVSAIVSPLIFSGFIAMSESLGLSIPYSFTVALIPLVVFFLIGFIIITRYKSVHEEYLDGERAPYKKLQKK